MNIVKTFLGVGYEPVGGIWVDTADFVYCQSVWMEKHYWVELERRKQHDEG